LKQLNSFVSQVTQFGAKKQQATATFSGDKLAVFFNKLLNKLHWIKRELFRRSLPIPG
jgi:hypothetical protein